MQRPAQAQQAHAFIRGQIRGMFGEESARTLPIQYGGSVKTGQRGLPASGSRMSMGHWLEAPAFKPSSFWQLSGRLGSEEYLGVYVSRPLSFPE